MARRLKALIVISVAAVAVSGSSARASEETFHCSVEPCTLTLQPDGTGTTAHQTLILKGETPAGSEASVSFTCDQLTGEATVGTKTTAEATFKNSNYEGCKGFGIELPRDFNSCSYRLTSTNGVSGAGSQLHLECSVPGDGINLTVKGVTCIVITPFTASGVKYHNIFKRKIVTAEMQNLVLPVGVTELVNVGNPSCSAVYNFKTLKEVVFGTGNTNIIAETHAGGEASVWFE